MVAVRHIGFVMCYDITILHQNVYDKKICCRKEAVLRVCIALIQNVERSLLLCPRPRRGGGGIKRSSASVVRPSVRLSV